ncbi:MAG: glycosyltransferase [Candidatus Caenarcaniphilales bacterium]|nr:glycosyltransferase [Candidatus Caenarcaniphilales bacterium]
MANTPKFSILIYIDRPDYVVSIESVLQQNQKNTSYELIVITLSETFAEIEEYLQAHKKATNFKVLVNASHEGQACAYRLGGEIASGEFVVLLEPGDRFKPNKLKRLAELIKTEKLSECLILHDADLDEKKTWFDCHALPRLRHDLLKLSQVPQDFCFFGAASLQAYSLSLFRDLIGSIPLAQWSQNCALALAELTLYKLGEIVLLSDSLVELSATCISKTESPQRQKLSLHLLYLLEKWLSVAQLTNLERQSRLAHLSDLARKERNKAISPRHQESLVSVIITNNNYAIYLDQAIRSVLNQTHQRFELIVVDDASSDQSAKCIQDWSNQDSRIKPLLLTKNLGQLGAMQKGYEQALGRYISFLDADDWLDETFLERHLQVHQHEKLAMVSTCDLRFINETNEILHDKCYWSAGAWNQPVEWIPTLKYTLQYWIFAPCSCNLIRKTDMLDLFFKQLDGETLEAFRKAGDWLVLYFAYALGGSIRFAETLVNFRLHDKNHATQLHFPTPLIRTLTTPNPDLKHAIIFLYQLMIQNLPAFQRYYTLEGLKTYLGWLLRSTNPKLTSGVDLGLFQKIAKDSPHSEQINQLIHLINHPPSSNQKGNSPIPSVIPIIQDLSKNNSMPNIPQISSAPPIVTRS